MIDKVLFWSTLHCPRTFIWSRWIYICIGKMWDQWRKESFNSDGQQFHQYQLNEESPLT